MGTASEFLPIVLSSVFYCSRRRGVVFGLWSACASVGNILGACLASSVLQYGYEYAFLVTAAAQFAGGIIIFFGLLVSPEEIGEEKRPFCSEHLTVMVRPARPGSCSLGEL